jgi:hypothetical protein
MWAARSAKKKSNRRARNRRLLLKIEDLVDALALQRPEETSKELLPYAEVRRRLKRAGKL